ncbi:hypothetical protein RDABS01_033142 [Bienertia sinuspersici]
MTSKLKSRRNDEEDSEGEAPLKIKRKSKIKASVNYFEVDEDDEEEVPVKTKKASKYKSRRNQGQEVDDDETEEVRFRTTKASKFKCKSKRVSDKEEDDDEEECGWKPKKASSSRERRGEYEAEEEEEEEEEQGVGAGGRRLSVSPAVYRDNSLSKGGLAKEKGCVQPNVNCRIESFGYTLMEFSDTKRKWVEEIGFDGLFSLIGKGLTRNLCYWLMTRVDVPNRIFISVDGKEFPLTKVQGDENGSLKEDLGRLWSKYSSKAPSGADGISRKNVVDVLLSDDVMEKDFKECFVMLALMDVLCPTTCHRMSSKLLPYVCYAVRARQYDWCSLVLEHLFHSIQNFAKRFYPMGMRKRQPTQWGVFPRLKAWSKKEMNKARACDELPTGDYGKLGVVDVAYGENHPLDCRDSMPGVRSGNFQSHMMTVDDLLNLIRSMGNVNNEGWGKEGGNRRRKDVKNPWQHKQDKESRQRESLTPLAREEENHYSENRTTTWFLWWQRYVFEEDGIRYEWGTTGMVVILVFEDAGDVGGGEENVGVMECGDELDDDGVVVMIVPIGLAYCTSWGHTGERIVMGVNGVGCNVKAGARTRTKSEYKHPLLKTIADFVLHYGACLLRTNRLSTQLLFDAVEKMQHSCCFNSYISYWSASYSVAMMYGRVWLSDMRGEVGQLVVTGSHDHESVSASDVIQRTVARIQDKDRIPTYSLNMVFVPVYEGVGGGVLYFLSTSGDRGCGRSFFEEGKYETGVVMLEVVKECSDRLLQSYDVGDLQNKGEIVV